MSLTKLQVQSKYPEVYESYTLQASLPEAKYVEKIKFWEGSNINCFERWTIPYFLEREKEKKRPCLRLNYPPDGKCNECTRGTCRYDKVCFMCGLEGHGAFQSFPGGKLKGELKCTKHRNFLAQLGAIRLQHGIDEDGLRVLFKLPGSASTTTKKATAAPAPAAAAVAPASGEATDAPANETPAASEPAVKGPAAAAAAKTETAPHVKNNGAAAKAARQANANAVAPAAPVAPVASVAAAPVPVPVAVAPVPVIAAAIAPVAAAVASAVKAPVSPPQLNNVGARAPQAVTDPANWSFPLSNANNNQNLNLGLNMLPGPGISDFNSMNSLLSPATGTSGGMAEDSGRRLWAGPSGSNSADLLSAMPMPSLLPAPSMPALLSAGGGKHAAAAGNGGNGLYPLDGSLSSGLNGGLGGLGGFDAAMSLGASRSPQQQKGFPGAMPPMFALPGGLTGPSGQPLLHFQSYELVDTDEFAPHASLRLPANPPSKDEANGSFVSKGALISHRGADDVLVRSWRKTGPIVDATALRGEIKALRILSRKCAHVAKILHLGTIDLSSQGASSGAASDLIGIVTETSELGTLDRFTVNHAQMVAQTAPGSPPGFSPSELQSMCVQLIEGLIQCHEMNIRHRDIRPQNILVSPCADKYQSRQFARGLQLKYANFTPLTLLPLCSAVENPLLGVELDKWMAPEVDSETRRTGVRFLASSDVWSLGLTIYYLATMGQLPFDSHKQACDAAANPDYRRACLEKHGLQERSPMLYDLIERLVRPSFMRTDLQIIRCHPFLWTLECRRGMLTAFANATMTRGSDVITNFVTGIDKISPLYVFGAEGWVAPMAPFLLALVPAKIKTDFWWSGTYLLQAIKNQLQFPESLQHVYPRMTSHQAVHAYLRQVTEIDFPRLLILLYELGGIHGKWQWDGDEIVHSWN